MRYTVLRKISILCAGILTCLMFTFFKFMSYFINFLYIVFMIFIHFSIIVVSFAFLIVINIQHRTSLGRNHFVKELLDKYNKPSEHYNVLEIQARQINHFVFSHCHHTSFLATYFICRNLRTFLNVYGPFMYRSGSMCNGLEMFKTVGNFTLDALGE